MLSENELKKIAREAAKKISFKEIDTSKIERLVYYDNETDSIFLLLMQIAYIGRVLENYEGKFRYLFTSEEKFLEREIKEGKIVCLGYL